MKNEIRERWTAALRSGEYRQGLGTLRNADDEYCCLGVLCDITRAETGGEWTKIVSFTGSNYFSIGGEEDSGVLPDEVARILRISPVGEFKLTIGGEEYSLAGLNDTGFTFSQIADIIDYFFSE